MQSVNPITQSLDAPITQLRSHPITQFKTGRVAMHAVREALLECQAEALGLPLVRVFIPSPCPNDVYERAMAGAVECAVADGITHMAFGDRRFAGREFDAALLDELPASVDPCGERGEFHTFAYRGPMFGHPIPVEEGVTIERDGFVFTDLHFPNCQMDRLPNHPITRSPDA